MKRFFDFTTAAVGLVLLSAIFLLLALLIAWRLGRPVFFVQERPGRGGRLFRMVKFRTMNDARDIHGNLLPDAERITPLGRWLRSLSLDELPELWNVLKGEMSLVGPRPLLTEYLPLYSERQGRRHEVRPGLTGWAQINGRNATTWEERFDLDVWYVDNRSFFLDLKILWLTVGAIFSRRGVSAEGHVTMPKFGGE